MEAHMTDVTFMNELREYLPFLIPLFIIQLALMIAALVHVFTHKNYRNGNRTLWVILIIFVNIIGPILYFVFGKDDSDNDEDEEERNGL